MASRQTAALHPADEKEAAIIAAARKTFLARGYDAASMDAIALTAGVSKRTVYNRFRSKEELFAAAIMETCRRILPLNIAELEASLPTEELLRQMSIIFLRGILEPEAIALRRIAAFEAMRNPDLGKTYLQHGPRLLVREATPMLERIAARGALRIDNIEEAIWRLGALITEPLFTEVIMGETPENFDAAIEKQIDSGLEAFFKIYKS